MFTGLIRCIGTVKSFRDHQDSRALVIGHDLGEVPLSGASIAVNGVCLTVLEGSMRHFTAECFFATLNKTGLKMIRPGMSVHLEPALTLGSPLDGHLLQGHISSLAKVLSNRNAGRGRELTLEIPKGEEHCFIPEGSVALDGVSLTISSLKQNSFSIQLIGETLNRSCLGSLKAGDRVNLETDMILRGRKPDTGSEKVFNKQKKLTEQQLLQWGYV